MPQVLLTGGSGFIGSHILDCLLSHGFDVVFTVRSPTKGDKVLASYPEVPRKKLSYVLVEDITANDAFHAAVKSEPPLDYVIHTASPYHFNVQDPVKDFHKPAVLGTTEILKAVATHAPTVRRVILTSTFGTIVNPWNHPKVYDETYWGPVTDESAMDPRGAYRAGKIFAEKAAWKFMEEFSPSFDLVTIHPPMVYGPVSKFLEDLDSLNTSNHRIRAIIDGGAKASGLQPTVVYLFADVRDVADAHVRALDNPTAGGQRFLVTGGHYSNKKMVDIVRESYPRLSDRLPPDNEVKDDTPEDVYGYDNKKSREILGLTYRSFEECVRDTVESLLSLADKSTPAPGFVSE